MSTVTRIVDVRDCHLQPAIGELVTSERETFPIFDDQVLKDAYVERELRSAVVLILQESTQSRTAYVRAIRPIDVTASSRPCLWCQYRMEREPASDVNGGVDQFVCFGCSHRLYLASVRAVPVEWPATARARLTLATDGLFALDHLRHEAFLMDECDCTAPNRPPWRGIAAELQPMTADAADHVHKSLKLIPPPFNGCIYTVP